MTLSIIIVNYNVKYFLEHCLCAIHRAIKNIDAEIIVIDNASADNSVAYLKHFFPGVLFIGNNQNTGYGRANNIGLEKATGKYILFLNPDTLIQEDTLDKCIAAFENDKQIGAMGVRMTDGSGRFLKESKRAFPSPLTSLYKLTGFSALFPESRIFARYYLGHLNEHQNHVVDVLCGAFLMTRKEILNETGGFDTDFFMYGEDIDLSYRIQQAGYKNYYLADTSIIHFKGESTNKGSLNYIKMFYQAMEIFVNKHYTGAGKGFFTFLLRMGIWLRAFINIFTSLIKKAGTKLFTTAKDDETHLSGIVAGNEQEYDIVMDILRCNNEHNTIIGRAGDSDSLKQLQKETGAEKIIFCPVSFGYGKTINAMQALGGHTRYRFYNSTGKSIIGSYSKHKSGAVAVLHHIAS